jgi:diguanylate cyclase (GGDEF)-like protein/PAS domain S-box-containing protein
MTENTSSCRAPHWREADRLAAVRSFGILDTEAEAVFDGIARIAAHICNAPIALITFLDENRQWFKAAIGVDANETSRELSVCTHAILEDGLFVVPDLKKDERFKNNPLVTSELNLSFYAGAPLNTKNALPLGTLCVLDHQARPQGLTEQQSEALKGLAQAVMSHLELRLSNRALATSEEFKHRLFASSQDCIKILDMECRLRFMNDGGMQALEVADFNDIEGRPWTDLLPGPAAEAAQGAIAQAKTGGTGRFQCFCPTIVGTPKWWDVVVTSITGEHGKPQGFLAISRDITDIHQAQEEIRRSESRFRTLVDVMPLSFLAPQVVWFCDKNGALTYCNEYWHNYVGRESKENNREAWARFVPPTRRQHALAAWEEALSKKDSFEFEIPIRRDSDGAYRWFMVRGQPLKNVHGEIEQWFGIAMDIHERKQSEEALCDSEERLRLALRAARMVAWEFNLKTRSTKRSENSLSLAGIGAEPDGELFEHVHPADRSKVDHFLERIEIYGADAVEYRSVLSSGQTRWLRARAERAGPDRVVGVTFDITDRKEAEEEIWRSANHDPLTGLPNRSLFQRRLDEALTKARENGTSVSLLMIDFDGFKDINDTLGHDAGDALLKEAAERLSAMVRDCDTVARLGGDEFALLVVEPLRLENSARLGLHIIESLRRPFTYQERTLTSRVSIGVAAFPDHDDQPAELMKDADIALYEAKYQGRNKVVTYSPEMRRVTEQRVSLGRSMREAIGNDEIIPFYQPKVCLSTGRIVGFEALARWQHPSRGILSPEVFGAAFDDHELASEIGKRLRMKIAADVRNWLNQDLSFGRIAINLSPSEFSQADIVDDMLRTLDWVKIPASLFEVEVTETVLLGRNTNNVSRILHQFREQNVLVALDDFGTGYASLTHLKQFPVDQIKIDRSFVRDLEHDPDDEAIIAAVIGLGRSLKLKVTAEGVETAGQAQRLHDLGCDHVQGYLYAKPMESARVPHLLAQWDRESLPPTRRRKLAALS